LAWDSFEGFLAEFFGGFGAKMLGIIFWGIRLYSQLASSVPLGTVLLWFFRLVKNI
jgi:hypothetical protein